MNNKSAYQATEEKIPRKLIQQEMTNETRYEKVKLKNTPKPAVSKDKFASAKVKIDLISDYEEIIPRLNKFPMQGRSISVMGHDD